MATDLSVNNKAHDFLLNIQIARPEISSDLLKDLFYFIMNSGCPDIGFEKMSDRAMGISKTDKCILNTRVLSLPIEYLLYIILHEVSHQYQYKKHGKNLVLDVYLESLDLEKAADKLLSIEKIADRLAIKKLKEILVRNGIEHSVQPRYLDLTDTSYIKTYLEKIRKEVTLNRLMTIEEINNYILLTYKPLNK